MTIDRQPSQRVLAERRRKRARARRRRAWVASAFVAALAALVAVTVGALDGGSVLRPKAATAHEEPARTVPPVVVQVRPRTSRELVDARVVDRVLRRMPLVAVAGRRHREIALTFDDGPGPYTLGLVRELKQLHAPATFFQIGFMIPLFPAAERAITRDRHFVIGDHTETHPMMGRLSPVIQRSQIDGQASQLYARHIPYPHLFRPPYGSYDDATLKLLRARHMLMVLWTVDSEDYLRPGARAIAERVLARARPGAIVLMHDAGGDRTQTIASLPFIVHGLRRHHYRLVTLPRLLHDAPPPHHQPRRVGAGIG